MTLTSVELLRKVVGVENVTAEETEALEGTKVNQLERVGGEMQTQLNSICKQWLPPSVKSFPRDSGDICLSGAKLLGCKAPWEGQVRRKDTTHVRDLKNEMKAP